MMTIFNDEFFENIPEDPKAGLLYIFDTYNQYIELSINDFSKDDDYGLFLDFYALISEFIELYELDISLFDLQADRNMNFDQYVQFSSSIRSHYQPQIDIENTNKRKEKFAARLRGGFAYEFTDGDINRVQELINQLRDMISNDDRFEDEHRARILRRLEKLQSEIHKRMSNIDTFWGLVGDTGVVIGKFGKDIEPIVARVREIKDIFWHAQSRAEQLPSNSTFRLLEDQTNEDES